MREMSTAEGGDVPEPLKMEWDGIMKVVDFGRDVVYAGVDERFPFMTVDNSKNGNRWGFNAHRFTGEHAKFCDEDDNGLSLSSTSSW